MKKSPPLGIYKKIATIFITLTLVVVCVVFYYSLSYAVLEIRPSLQKVEQTVNFIITDSATSSPEKGIFRGQIIKQQIGNIEKEFPATGTKTVKSNASGKVTIISSYSRPQPLVKTTRLLTPDGVLFRISEGVTVPANGSVEAGAYQDDPAQNTSLTTGTKLSIPGLSVDLQKLIYAEVKDSFSGSENTVKIVSSEDLDNAVSSIVSEEEQKIKAQLPSNSSTVLRSTITKKDLSVLADTVADKFQVTLSIDIDGAAFDTAQISDYLQNAVSSSLTPDVRLKALSADEIEFTVGSYDPINQLLQMNANINGRAVIRKNSSILNPANLVKMNGRDLKSFLEASDLIDKVELKFFPGWVRSIPKFEDHLIIKIDNE